MRARKVAALAAGVLGLVLGSATAASAATRYVSPAGPGVWPCATAQTACPLPLALTSALSGDDVVLAAGEYSISTPLSVVVPLNVAGADGAPRPHITLAGTSANPGSLSLVGGTLRHLDITGTATLALGTATLDDSIVTSAAATAVSLGSALVRNSVIDATAAGATAISLATSPAVPGALAGRLLNATVMATGLGSTAIRVAGSAIFFPGTPPVIPDMCLLPAPATLDLRNVIARGAGQDLSATDGPCGASAATIAATSSSFDPAHSILGASSLLDGGGNQSAAPLFVDQAAGDLREAAGSPTIDAGTLPAVPSDIGTLDLAGVSRVVGLLPDIGAFEFVPPVTVPGGGTPGGGESPGGGGPGGGSNPGGTIGAAPIVKLLKPAGLRLRMLPTRGWVVRVSCSAACTFAVTLTPATGRRRVLARGTAVGKAAGTTRLRLKVTSAGRRVLKGKRSMRLRFAVVGRDAAGHTGHAQRVVNIRR